MADAQRLAPAPADATVPPGHDRSADVPPEAAAGPPRHGLPPGEPYREGRPAPPPPPPSGTARRRRWRVARNVVVVLFGAVLLSFAWIAWRLWLPLPTTSGRQQVAGIAAPLEILRDVDGVPHVRAASEADAYFGLGYVHAQDRLWQMEFQRRVGHGRLAELLGPAALPSDRLFRTLGLTEHASSVWRTLSPSARTVLEAYVRGVNAFVDRRAGRRLPVEFALLRAAPEAYRPEDVIVWMSVLTWELSTNWRDEILRARIAARVGDDGAAALMPAYTEGAPVILPEGFGPAGVPAPAAPATGTRPSGPAADLEELAAALRTYDALTPSIAASNNWVLSGARTSTGRPLLANDPHLGAQIPAVWYLAHVQGGALDAVGATLPGVPGIVIGHNGRIAWGVTNVMADNQDLFVERVNARHEVFHRDTWEPMRVRHETIRVKGAPDERLEVRTTRHGPLVSGLVPGATSALALAWTALAVPNETATAWLDVAKATDWTSFTAALSRVRAPMQNFVYADLEGNIGYFAPGAIPLRVRGHDGTVPVTGWTGEFDWLGEVPPDAWPRIYNPTRGFVATANNPTADPMPYVLSSNWEPGYRAARIVELIEQTPAISPDRAASMQADIRSAQARVVLPWLRRARVQDAAARAALDRLRLWDGTVGADRPEAAIYEAWLQRVSPRLFADELGEEVWRDYSRPVHWIAKALHRMVVRGDDTWCDDVRTPERESCDAVLGTALSEAVAGLTDLQGGDPDGWRWGPMNRVVFPHLPLHLAAWLRPVFSRSVHTGGDAVTVTPVMRIGERLVVSSYRQVVDLSNLEASRFVTTTGQSGQVFSRRYDDLIPRWRAGEYLPMRFSRGVVDAATDARLELVPK